MARVKANARPERMRRFVCVCFFMFYCFICVLFFSVSANEVFANSFLVTVAQLVRADVTHNSHPTFPRGSLRRTWTETIVDKWSLQK